MKSIKTNLYAGPHEIYSSHAAHGLIGTFTKFNDAKGVTHQASIVDAVVIDDGRAIEITLSLPDEANLGQQENDLSHLSFGLGWRKPFER